MTSKNLKTDHQSEENVFNLLNLCLCGGTRKKTQKEVRGKEHETEKMP